MHQADERNDRDQLAGRARSARAVAALLALAAAATLAGCASTADTGARPPEVSAPKPSLEEQWGVHVLGVHLSARGYMLDFRYRVLDPDKARPVFDRKIHPMLIDDASGAKMIVPDPPKIGSLRNTGSPIAGKNYFVIFGNPGKFVKPGSRVTVVIGEFRAPNLVVE